MRWTLRVPTGLKDSNFTCFFPPVAVDTTAVIGLSGELPDVESRTTSLPAKLTLSPERRSHRVTAFEFSTMSLCITVCLDLCSFAKAWSSMDAVFFSLSSSRIDLWTPCINTLSAGLCFSLKAGRGPCVWIVSNTVIGGCAKYNSNTASALEYS